MSWAVLLVSAEFTCASVVSSGLGEKLCCSWLSFHTYLWDDLLQTGLDWLHLGQLVTPCDLCPPGGYPRPVLYGSGRDLREETKVGIAY